MVLVLSGYFHDLWFAIHVICAPNPLTVISTQKVSLSHAKRTTPSTAAPGSMNITHAYPTFVTSTVHLYRPYATNLVFITRYLIVVHQPRDLPPLQVFHRSASPLYSLAGPSQFNVNGHTIHHTPLEFQASSVLNGPSPSLRHLESSKLLSYTPKISNRTLNCGGGDPSAVKHTPFHERISRIVCCYPRSTNNHFVYSASGSPSRSRLSRCSPIP